jgi:hypothetical protein
MTIDSSSISGNRAVNDDQVSGGGGVWNNGTMTITNSTIANNTATALAVTGGGIVNTDTGTLTIVNSTIALNAAVASNANGWVFGGGIYNEGKLSLASDTIARNTALSGIFGFGIGGGVFNEIGIFNSGIGTITTGNTIFGNNSAPTFGNDVFGTVTSTGNNLISSSFGGDGFGATDMLNIDPMLDKLLLPNGGPTLTMALLPGSLAIDHGNNVNATQFDQRGTGYNRIVNGTIDIGAFEFGAGPAPSIRRAASVPDGSSQLVPNLGQGSAAGSSASDLSSTAASQQLTAADNGTDTLPPAAAAPAPISLLQSAQNAMFAALDDSQLSLVW